MKILGTAGRISDYRNKRWEHGERMGENPYHIWSFDFGPRGKRYVGRPV
jgi:hypothetical protein